MFPQPTRDENQSFPTGRKAIGLSHQEQREQLGPSRSNLAHHPRQPGPRSHRHCPLLPQRPRALCSSQSHIALLVVVEGEDEPRCGQRAGLHEGQQASALNSGEWVGGSLPATGRNSLIRRYSSILPERVCVATDSIVSHVFARLWPADGKDIQEQRAHASGIPRYPCYTVKDSRRKSSGSVYWQAVWEACLS